jgi:hypothetical protein
MDRAPLEERLSIAEEKIRQHIEHIRKQRERVQWLESDGRDAAQDQKALYALEDSLLVLMGELDRLSKELEEV